ncbi:unnamed protein product [Linum tenue]|uniref:Small ubiquitin-related modifier n=1 Tax=Linum tenue TaxID=586396 RepID=A0AAV0GN77_9ROSI|nr:unnamed protein product [Linum tenue]CAI0437583.1 unnamed protein product [Linum tenue]
MDQEPTHKFIHVKVVGQVSSLGGELEVFFRIKESTPLWKLMAAYCRRIGMYEVQDFAFIFDQRLLRPHQTPKQVHMEDGDVIDALLNQTGS